MQFWIWMSQCSKLINRLRSLILFTLAFSATIQLMYLLDKRRSTDPLPNLLNASAYHSNAKLVTVSRASNQPKVLLLPQLRDGCRCSDVAGWFPDSIPPLVHWTSKDGRVPAQLIPIVKSWKRLLQVSISNSTGGGFSPHQWHFMHWDDQQIRQLVSKHYPRLTPSYNKLVNGLERSDIGRLVVLHHIGGVYVDLDVELVRDPTPLLRPSRLGRVGLSPNFSCESAVWSQEPAAHPMFIFNMTSLISNAVILSRANHSFLSFVLNEWPSWFEKEWENKTKRLDAQAVFVTGPMMLQTFYNRYTAMRRGDRPADWCSDMLAESDTFQPISDWYLSPGNLKKACAKTAKLSGIQQLYCKQLAKEKFKEKQVPKSSYAVHKFMHLSYASRWKTIGSLPFTSILPILTCKI